MLTIPVPFVVSLLLAITAVLLFLTLGKSGLKSVLFTVLCAVCTFIVGMRWTFDLQLLRFVQPILASMLPIAAWYCFAKAHHSQRPAYWHGIWPIVIAVSSFNFAVWPFATDTILITLYLGYGGALIVSSFTVPEEVRLSNVQRVIVAERVAGVMLLFSALIDSALSYDFAFYHGEHAPLIISLSYLVLIPMVVCAVAIVGFSTASGEKANQGESLSSSPSRQSTSQDDSMTAETTDSLRLPENHVQMSDDESEAIMGKLDGLMEAKHAYRDPDITLSRLSRRLGIPAKQLSSAVNKVKGENISKVINAYRIEHAKTLLVTTQDNITDIYLASGFQTKSNFNREFLRITGQTPSVYRQSAQLTS
ncbi:AraC family transcriptional regulator [Enterovibrio makurazakiensis]|uniref:helix-turn-helix domain-containing protein n=1 Tax=Enterovibrio makurazakiensis TaxID=2910232 RepID=UPI003D21091B